MVRNKLLRVLVVALLVVAPLSLAPPVAQQQSAPSIDPSTEGRITGKVSFEGARPRVSTIVMEKDPVCAQEHKEPVYPEDGAVNADGTVPNAFIYVKQGAEKYSFAVPTTSVTLDQRGCMYHPHVLGVMAGQELQIVSSDPTTHNIHPMPKQNREWNQSQPPGAPPLVKKFARPEIMIAVKCNQHPWMRAYIGVTSNPFFAVTGPDGTFEIRGVPPGDYTIEAWTATFGTQEKAVSVSGKEPTKAEFNFSSH